MCQSEQQQQKQQHNGTHKKKVIQEKKTHTRTHSRKIAIASTPRRNFQIFLPIFRVFFFLFQSRVIFFSISRLNFLFFFFRVWRFMVRSR